MTAQSDAREESCLRQRGLNILKKLRERPTVALQEAYFKNLHKTLAMRAQPEKPGSLAIGIGAGRCGSTTLCRLLSTVQNSCITHEVPRLISWWPEPDEIAFHLERFDALLKYFDFVFDAAHWWINVLPTLVSRYPNLKVLGLVRDDKACAASFDKIPMSPTRHIANWRELGIPADRDSPWSRTYPSYQVAPATWRTHNGKVPNMTYRYVSEYNGRLVKHYGNASERALIIGTQELSNPRKQNELFEFIGHRGENIAHIYNQGSTADGAADLLLY